MNNGKGKGFFFSREDIADALQIWNSAAISLIDIRYNLISPSEAIRAYRMPTSSFIYTRGTKAELSLDSSVYTANRFGIFHGGKGTELSIRPIDGWLEYYMVLYKAEEPPFNKSGFNKLMEGINPFLHQYGFTPNNPIFFWDQLHKMYEEWKQPTPLEMFYEKAVFYQLVYEIYRELSKRQVQMLLPDVVAMAKGYMDRHYSEGISIQSLANLLGLSPSYFRSLFKKREGVSPQKYLINRRINAANNYLQDTDYSLREIAFSLGFYDEYHFSSAYKKATGITPNEYKTILIEEKGDSYMENIISFPYNEKNQVSLGKLKEEGDKYMFKLMRSKSIVAVALSLMLLLSACGTAPVNNSGEDSTPPPAVTETTEPVEEGTRIVSTVMGDVEVPANPKRVVVNWYTEDTFALGLNIVGSTTHHNISKSTLYYDQIIETYYIENWEPEEVMSLEPDLIITFAEDDYDKFGKIAPVLVVRESEMNSIERLAFLGEATGRTVEAKKAIDTFESKLATAKEVLNNKGFEGEVFSINQDWGSSGAWAGIEFHTESRGGTVIYEHLGFKIPDKVQNLLDESGKSSSILSYEVAHEYFGDYIIWVEREGSEQEYQETEIWKSVPAVINENIITISAENYGLFFSSNVSSLTAQLDYLVDALNSMVD